MEPDGPQHELPAACVIAQQHSFSTFLSLLFFIAKKISGPFQRYYFNFFYFSKELLKSEIV
jgi:hypothetical protein